MPLVKSTYPVNRWFINGHIETIVPALFRKVSIAYTRERIVTPDGDFLDIDWIKDGSNKLVIITHGLEGSSDRPYIKGMAKVFSKKGYDVLAWNFRGCGGEANRQLRFYHSGATDDLSLLIQHAISQGYDDIYLIGFSLGGNMTLKYLGEQKDKFRNEIKKAVVFSVPLDLYGSSNEISKVKNVLYAKRFLKNLKKKIRKKASLMPERLTDVGLSQINTMMGFDDQYTAPIHGYDNAIDYYTKCSSIHFLKDIHVPTLIVNARNDSFLSESCYPYEQLKTHPFVHFESPKCGGHCGFPGKDRHGYYWSENRAFGFIHQPVS